MPFDGLGACASKAAPRRHRPKQTTLYRLVQAARRELLPSSFFAQAEDAAGADPPQFVKDEFDAFLECGILVHGFLRLRRGDCDHVIPHVPVRQWVLIWVMRQPMPMPMPLRLLLATQPKLVTPVLQVVHRVITRHLLGQAGLKPDEADIGAPSR